MKTEEELSKEKEKLFTQSQNIVNKIVPCNIEIELAILGALLIDEKAIEKVFHILTSKMFYDPQHQIIYDAISFLYKNNLPIDILTVNNRLEELYQLEQIGGSYYIATLAGKVASSAHIVYHSYIIQQKYILRLLLTEAENLKIECYRDNNDIYEIIQNEIDILSELLSINRNSGIVSFNDTLMSTATEIDKNYEHKENIYISGFQKFDSMMALHNDTVLIIAGDKGSGKTNFVNQLIYKIANQNKQLKFLYVTMEDPKEKMIRRFLSLNTGLSDRKILSINNSLDDNDFMNIGKKMSDLKNKNFDMSFIDFKLDINMLMRYSIKFSEQAKKENKNLIIIIDNLGLIEAPGYKEEISRENFIAQKIIEIKQKTQALIIVIHHLNKSQNDKRNLKEGYRPREEYIRGSSRILDYCNQALLVNYPKKYPDLLSIYKSRLSNIDFNKELRMTYEDFDNSFWKINPKKDKLTLGYNNIYQATFNKLEEILISNDTIYNNLPVTMNNLFYSYYTYSKKIDTINDQRDLKYQMQKMSIFTFLQNKMYKEQHVIDRNSRDFYLFDDKKLTPQEEYDILSHLFILEACKLRDFSSENTIMRFHCDLNKNIFYEL